MPTADTATCRWRGERMDYGLAVEVLFGRRAQAAGSAENVSAETSR